MDEVLNIAAYRFVDIDDGPALRERLAASASAAGLKGTVLIAPEGINLVLAGAPAALRGWLAELGADSRFAALQGKQSLSRTLPFGRLRVKLKQEIIRMNQPQLRPAAARAPAVDAATLARWLAQGHCDAGRPLALLDTRNGFEVEAGAFDAAIDWRLQRFSDFPAAFDAHRKQLDGKTVVSYCTGGIRCEKAALLMHQRGQPHVLQLDGGILQYLQHYLQAAGGAPHWRGDCFVFDERVALNASLQAATGTAPA